jgi:hypothetical protein
MSQGSDYEGIASAVASLAAELREDRNAIRAEIKEDRVENGRQIAELTGAIREQAAQQKSFHESLQEQWLHIDKQRDTISAVRSEAAAIASSRVWSKETREVMLQIACLIVAIAGLLAGPVATYVAFAVNSAVSPVTERQAKIESAQTQMALHQAWQNRMFKVQAQLASQGVSVDWGDDPAL